MCNYFHLREGIFSILMRSLFGLSFDGRRDEGFLKLKAQKEILTIWSAAQDRGMEQGNGTRQLGLVNKRDGNLEGNLGTGIQIAFGGKQHATG